MYYVNYGTGAGDFEAETLEEAMQQADDGLCYTQMDVVITDEEKNIVAARKWWGVSFDPTAPENYEDGELIDVVKFGNFGYYAPWIIF